MKVNIKDRVMTCYMCHRLTRLDNSGLCPECRAQKELKKDTLTVDTSLNAHKSSKITPE